MRLYVLRLNISDLIRLIGGSAAGSRITSANGATYLHGDASRAVQELEGEKDSFDSAAFQI